MWTQPVPVTVPQSSSSSGADVNTQAADLATPLLIASQEGHQACVDLLLDHGADPNRVCSKAWPQFPIHAAAEFGHIGYWLLIILCFFHALFNSICLKQYQLNKHNCDWFHLSANHLNLILNTLYWCLDVVQLHTLFLYPILVWFCWSSILRRLIAVTDRVCDSGDAMLSPLYLAIRTHQSKSVELLLREGYSPDAQDSVDLVGANSPLSLALLYTPTEPFRFVRNNRFKQLSPQQHTQNKT